MEASGAKKWACRGFRQLSPENRHHPRSARRKVNPMGPAIGSLDGFRPVPIINASPSPTSLPSAATPSVNNTAKGRRDKGSDFCVVDMVDLV